jgi:hypothetical protein
MVLVDYGPLIQLFSSEIPDPFPSPYLVAGGGKGGEEVELFES